MSTTWTSGTWIVKDGREDDFVAAWRDLAAWTAGQFPGSQAWLLRDRERPNQFLSAGPWAEERSITAWRASEGFRERVARIRELLVSFEARTMDQVASSDPLGADPGTGRPDAARAQDPR